MGCNCGSSSMIVVGGDGILITGSGSSLDPTVVAIQESLIYLQASDTATVDLSVVGAGTKADPFLLSAAASLGTIDLKDVDPGGIPTLGDTLVWDGTKFIFDAPPSVPPGAVNTGAGVAGDGSIGNPIRLPLSELAETSASGLGIYVDSLGKIRAMLPTVSAVTWAAITGKPADFPTTWSTVTAKPTTFPSTWASVTGIPSTFPSSAHTHPSTDITGAINAATVGGRHFFVQSATPVGAVDGDIWIQTT